MSALKNALTGLIPHRDHSSDENREARSSSRSRSKVFSLSPDSARQSTEKFPSKSRDGRSSSPAHSRNSTDHQHHRLSHSPLSLLRQKARASIDSPRSSSEHLPLDRDGMPMSRGQQRKHDKQVSKEVHRKEAEARMEADKQHRRDMETRAVEEQTDEQKALYGTLPINSYSGKEGTHDERVDIRTLTPSQAGDVVTFRARIHNLRNLSAHLMFIELRQGTATIQGILHEHDNVTKFFLYWAEHLHIESVVRVKGVIQEPKAKQGEVMGVSIHNLEIKIHEMHVEATPSEPLAFTVHEAEVTKAKEDDDDKRHRVSDRARQSNRVIDLRTPTSQGIFRIQSAICQAFRMHLYSQGFMEIHTPKLWGAASESGASVFKVDYFGRPAFLAQSPQLGKQMCVAADMRRVFEIGPVFRAENSNTHRHLTEFTGLDIEMAIDSHYHEVLRVLDGTFKAIFKYVYEHCKDEIAAVKLQFPHEDLVWLEETPIIRFSDAIRMLNESGYRGESGEPLPENEDMGTRDEIALGALIKEKYATDYYVLDKFPVTARPFYAMADPDDPTVTNAFDIFVRGQEILSGGQRIHDAPMLIEKMEKAKLDPSTMEEYLSGFEWGAPPHGGGGIGLERILMLLLKLGDIRNASLFARDPRSLPYKPPVKTLRYPASSTLDPPWKGQDRVAAGLNFQPLEELIGNYGDASNTSWLEPKFEIWRDEHTGAAVGFVVQDGFAITVGDPLCHSSQYIKTVGSYLRFLKKTRHAKPLWLLCGAAVEDVLSERFDWRSLSVVAEQRIDPNNNPAAHDADLQRKCRHATKEGVKLHDIPLGTPIPDEVRSQVDKRIQDWLHHRKGKQVHLTDVHPWQDAAHRQYHYATHGDAICGLVILAQLSPEHGWQVKFALDFPDAPSGSIEQLVLHALKQAAASGETSVTFGSGATAKLTPGRNLKGARAKVLAKTYSAIASELKLTNKSEFREKLGAYDDPVYVCYPPRGLGPGGVRAILNFFQDDDDDGRM